MKITPKSRRSSSSFSASSRRPGSTRKTLCHAFCSQRHKKGKLNRSPQWQNSSNRNTAAALQLKIQGRNASKTMLKNSGRLRKRTGKHRGFHLSVDSSPHLIFDKMIDLELDTLILHRQCLIRRKRYYFLLYEGNDRSSVKIYLNLHKIDRQSVRLAACGRV